MIDAASILDALALPEGTRIGRRVPKTLFVENGAPTAADKRLIQDGIEQAHWVASLKPNTVGISAWESPKGNYVEIAVLTVHFRPEAKVPRLTALIHRAIPYPLLLIGLSESTAFLSMAHKRLSEAESGKHVLEDTVHTSPTFELSVQDPLSQQFLKSLSLHRQVAENLRQLYQHWVDRITEFHAAQLKGAFRSGREAAESALVREVLERREELNREITSLRTKAKKERQISRRADLNLKIKTLEKELVQITEKI